MTLDEQCKRWCPTCALGYPRELVNGAWVHPLSRIQPGWGDRSILLKPCGADVLLKEAEKGGQAK